MPLLSPPRPPFRRAFTRAASALALLALTASAASAQTVSLSADQTEFSENGGVAVLTATISPTNPTDPTTVALSFRPGFTAEGGDFTRDPANFEIVIPAGQDSGTLTLTGVNDGDTADEQFTLFVDQVNGTTVSGGDEVAFTILDDDDPVTLSLAASDDPIAEDGGTSTITATLSEPTNADVTVTLSTDGDGVGYSLSPTTVTIPRGETGGTATATLTASDDADTDSETVTISASVSGGNVTGSASTTVTITDDDGGATNPTNPTVTLSIDDDEIEEAGGVATITATLTQATNEAVEVDLTPRAGFTTDAGDLTFNPSTLTITIPQGQTTGTLTATANPDADDVNETVTLEVTEVRGGGATEGTTPQAVTITILDDDGGPVNPATPLVNLSVDGENVVEGASTTIRATLAGGATASGDVTVNLAYSGGSGEFTAPTAITIPSGQNEGTIAFTAIDDAEDEDNETVTVSITDVSGNAEENGNQTATVTIVDNDGGFAGDRVTASFGQTTVTVDESAGSVTIPIRLSATLSSPVSVTVTLAEGDSADVAGFTSRTVTIPAGSDSAAVTVTLTDDAVAEEDETFTLRLSSTDARVEVEDGTVVVTVTDGDAPAEDGVTITEYDSVVRDGDARFVELRTDGPVSFGGLSLVYLAADSTVVEVEDLEGRTTGAGGFAVISDDDDNGDDDARRAALVPDSFVGVAVVRGTPPAVGTTFAFDGPNVVDVLFVDEAALARSRGLDPEDGSIQRQASGQPAFATPATPGGANSVGVPVSNETEGPLAEAVGDVFPNPSFGRAALELTVGAAQQVRVSVFDALGRRVAVAYDGEARPGVALRVPLGGAALAPGVYVVRVDGETFTEARRLTVAR